MDQLLIIKTGRTFSGIEAGFGDFEHMIARSMGLNLDRFLVCEPPAPAGDGLPDPMSCSGAVITGSHAMVTDNAPWMGETAAWLRQATQAGLPILGICFGHQLLAQALGGRSGFHPLGREAGTVLVTSTPEAERDALFQGLGSSYQAHVSHAQSVLELPPGSVLLAGGDYEPHQAVRFASRVWGVQFHPEFNAGVTRMYVQAQAEQLRAEGRDVEGILEGVCSTNVEEVLLARFLNLVSTAREQAGS